MASADNTPDFDSMTPDEITAWLETLAKRQGANVEELTTAADAEIAEIDPDSVVIDEPGYVPYGEERPPIPPAPPQTSQLRPPVASVPPPRATGTIPPARPPISPPRPPLSPARSSSLSSPFSSTPPAGSPRPPTLGASLPRRDPIVPPPRPPARPPDPEPPAPSPSATTPPAMNDDAFAWLESLAADQGDSLFNLDLSDIAAEVDSTPARSEPPAEPAVNPMQWLQSLTLEDDPQPRQAIQETPVSTPAPEPPPTAPTDEVVDPFSSGVDPMAWLENLARRQGARSEELTTNTRMNIPLPDNPVIDEPGYRPFSFDSPTSTGAEPRRPAQPEDDGLENPARFLESLSDSQGFNESLFGRDDEPVSDESDGISSIERAITSGTVTPEQMQSYLEHQTDEYVRRLDEPEVVEAEEPPVPAELPDWLLEQVGMPPQTEEPRPAEARPPALIDEIQEPPNVTDMPDWLREDIVSPGDLDLASIFDDVATDDESFGTILTFPVTTDDKPDIDPEIDPSDPWVEAFELEQEQGQIDIDKVPDWYSQNLADPDRIAAVDRLTSETASAGESLLAHAALPVEEDLPPGEPEPLPDWLGLQAANDSALPDWLSEESTTVETVAAAEGYSGADDSAAVAEVPDWLREVQETVEADAIPDWLTESLEDAPPADGEFIASDLASDANVVTPLAAPQAAEPRRAERPPVNVSATVEFARTHARQGDVASALIEYESLIRLNRELDAVVDDLQSLVRAERGNPALHRVLGDGLMRQGNLQAALDTYREALNLL